MGFPREHVELLAETIYLAFISDGVPTYQHDWVHATPRTKGDFRRAAQAALRTISDNRDWLLTDCEREGHEVAPLACCDSAGRCTFACELAPCAYCGAVREKPCNDMLCPWAPPGDHSSWCPYTLIRQSSSPRAYPK